MPVRVKLLPCFGSLKQVRTELLWEPSLLRGPLWKNTHFIERNASRVMVPGQTGKPLCQELMVNLASPGGKMECTSTEWGHPTPLTLVASPPGWDDYLDLGKTVTEMANRLMEEDGQQAKTPSKAGATPKRKDITQVKALPPSDDITMLPDSAFPSFGLAGSSRDNPVHLSDATDASASGSHPTKDTETEDDAMVLSHFSDALSEMVASITDLEDGYFKALHEVIIKTEKALRDMSCINTHYVSRMVTVMTSWQEAVQAATSHVEGVDTTTYLVRREDVQRATHEYVQEVVQACEEHDATHREEQKKWVEAIKADDFEDPVVRLLHVTHKAAHTQAEKAVDAFLSSIKSTLHKHIPTHAQGPLIANALSTAFQFQMSMWHMIGEECVCPVWARHSDWCGLAGIIQAIVETFSKNCALMFPPPPVPMILSRSPAPSGQPRPMKMTTMTTTHWVPRVFAASTPTHPRPLLVGTEAPAVLAVLLPSYPPLPHGGAFHLASDPKEMPSSAAGMPPGDEGMGGGGLFDEELDMVLEADDEADANKEPAEDVRDELEIDPEEVQMLKQIIKPATGGQPSTAPKSGDKWGSTHLDSGSGSSDSSGEDLDASRGTRAKKKTSTLTKASHPNQWSEEDIDIMRQIHYKTDLQRFQTYRTNKIDPANLASINTRNHTAYLEVAWMDPGSVIKKSVFSMVAYRATLKEQGGDTSKFDKEVGTNFKKGAKGSRAPDSEKVPIDWVMLVCQHENGVDIAYSDPDGFGRPGTMGLWDLHSTNVLSRAKMQL